MGAISLEKFDHLFWLGRYTERVFSTLRTFCNYYDEMIDKDENKYREFCDKLDIPDIYGSKEVFINKYLFDKTNPNSISSSMIRAFDNAVVMRKELTTETLLYIQLSLNELEKCKESDAPLIGLQHVIDWIFAFWGSVDDNVESEKLRNIIKCGRYLERVDLYCRLSYSQAEIIKEFNKLKNRITKIGIPYNEALILRLDKIINNEEVLKNNYFTIVGNLSKVLEVI